MQEDFFKNAFSPEQLSQLRRSLIMVWESAPGWTGGSIALLVVQSVLPLLSVWLVKLLVDGVVSIPATGKEAPFPGFFFSSVC